MSEITNEQETLRVNMRIKRIPQFHEALSRAAPDAFWALTKDGQKLTEEKSEAWAAIRQWLDTQSEWEAVLDPLTGEWTLREIDT